MAALLLILANLFLILILFFLFFRAFFKFIGEDTLNNWNLEQFIPKNPLKKDPPPQVDREAPANDSNAQYTPEEDGPTAPVDLDQFTPDFTKPIKIQYEEAGDDHGLEVKVEDES